MLPSWAPQTITVVRPVMVDDRGTLVPDYDAPGARHDVPDCVVIPGASEEDLAGRTNVTARWTVYAPPGADVEAADVVAIEGTPYQVDGQPARWTSPTGGLDHVVILLVDSRG